MHRIFFDKVVIFFLVLSLGSCVSRSTWDERFTISESLSAPSVAQVSELNQFKFAMVGDLHVSNGDTQILRQILKGAQDEQDEFIVLLGDLVDRGDVGSFTAIKDALKAYGFEGKVLSLIGNHEIFEGGWQDFRSVWGASHYSISIGNSQFVVLDTADGVIGESQFEWLREALQKNTESTHTFILSHYMPVVPGQRTYLRLSNLNEAERLMKLSSVHGVRGVFGGHYHSFCQEKIAGVEYIVAGGGGGRRMEPIKNHFFVQVAISGSNVSYHLRLID
jgi:predicted phosphodiesterase